MKELVSGILIGSIIFLAVIGVNVTPLILITFLVGGFYFFYIAQGTVKFENIGTDIRLGTDITFEHIGGQDNAIKELEEALEFIIKPEEIIKMGIRPLKGVLLVGPPGTGKTLMAKAAASYTRSAFIATSGSEFIEVYAGMGAKRVRQLFNDARKKASKQNSQSAIIFIDELEILGGKRGSHNSHMEYDQTLNQLLVEMDGISFKADPRILIIGATNRADMLDSALLRPGRFDRHVQVSLPDKVGRRKILDIHAQNKPVDDDNILDDIAAATFGFSGAHLESLTNEAAILALRENANSITERHFNEAIDKVILGEKLDKKPSRAEVERVSVHESGHALISELIKPGSVSSLTIIPRGRALGFMRKTAQDDQYLYTRGELEGDIMVALAGAAAEEIKYGNRSTGAASDFEQSWELAMKIVETGLSSIGVVNRKDTPDEILYKECKEIISNLENRTRELLISNKESLFSIADNIVAEEILNRERFMELLQLN
ncbi:cell division protein ftsh [hydrocarbon metagenome]|uniref:Cell division protein ftsh n=1 Tax=hydrocarbon metagenome TaxID=938273 RepID=A0A0W8E583_9ZZZZ